MPTAATHRGTLRAAPELGDAASSPASDGLGHGTPLERDARWFMQSRFGRDFSTVRIHTDTAAADSARAVRARAYTVGEHVVFGANEYVPHTDAGRRLLSHELAHVVQQRRHPSLSRTLLQRFDSPEHVELGDTAGGPTTGLILLLCHERDFPERTKPLTEWSRSWQALYWSFGPSPSPSSPEGQQRRALTQGLTYGEVVALSGDMYRDFSALNDASLKEVIKLIPLIRSTTTATEDLQAATGGRYLALAKLNESHFSSVPAGRRNIDVWRQTHRQAIAAARQKNANMAWGLNASADHYLTDAFSGGHIRTPRAALMGSDLGNIESKVLHDLDSKYAVEVTNPRGDPPWLAYGDNLLDDPRNAVSRTKALEAVRLSKQDIADALSQRSSYPDPLATATFPPEAVIPRPVDPARDRWSGRTPSYTAGRGGPVRRADDYTAMWENVILSEGPGFVKGLLADDDEVRTWVATVDLEPLGRQPWLDKTRMLHTLIGGWLSWISESDMVAMEKILRSVTSSDEMNLVRQAMKPRELDFSDLGQRTRFRIALARTP